MLRTALIGLGRIGWQFHLPQIIAHDGYGLCAVVDTSGQRLAEAYEQYGVRGYSDYKAMLAEQKPEVVVIASPTIYHEEQAVEAMRAGADVILDKPIAPGLDAARRIEQAGRQLGRKLVVYQPYRCVPDATVARRVIQEGLLGDIFMIKRVSTAYVRRNDWQAFQKFGGGMLNNYGAHFIDQMLFLSGSRTRDVYCQLHTVATLGDADDVVKVLIKTESGMTLDVEINEATPFQFTELAIFGKCGSAVRTKDDVGNPVLRAQYFDPARLGEIEISEELAAKGRVYPHEQIPWQTKDYPLTAEDQIDYYARCYDFFANGAPSIVPVEETIHLMEVIDRCRRIAEQPNEGRLA